MKNLLPIFFLSLLVLACSKNSSGPENVIGKYAGTATIHNSYYNLDTTHFTWTNTIIDSTYNDTLNIVSSGDSTFTIRNSAVVFNYHVSSNGQYTYNNSFTNFHEADELQYVSGKDSLYYTSNRSSLAPGGSSGPYNTFSLSFNGKKIP